MIIRQTSYFGGEQISQLLVQATIRISPVSLQIKYKLKCINLNQINVVIQLFFSSNARRISNMPRTLTERIYGSETHSDWFDVYSLKQITGNQVSTFGCTQRIKFKPASFKTHSFRIDRASDLASKWVPESSIMQLGRWRSDAYISYIRSLLGITIIWHYVLFLPETLVSLLDTESTVIIVINWVTLF